MKYLALFLVLPLLAGCYQKSPTAVYEPAHPVSGISDSLAFRLEHHFSNNYNFLVASDSLVLIRVQPEETVADLHIDTFAIYRNEHVVVSDIRVIPGDTIDSVWVELADNRAMFGWLHEEDMLQNLVPDDPISQFIRVFSGAHLVLFLVFLVLIAAVYMVVILRKNDAPFVHWRDISSFYPSLLCLVVALAAVLYTSIQMFAAESWREFYFNPTLNPFSVPVILSLFLISVWAVIIICIAVIDVVFKQLHLGNALLYLGSVGAVCIINYIVFGLATRYYAGYPLLAAYIFFALHRYFRYSYKPYECGKCGGRMRRKGRCPYCGTMNE